MTKRRASLSFVLTIDTFAFVGTGWDALPPDDGNGGPPPGPVFNNTTHRSNRDATNIGADMHSAGQ